MSWAETKYALNSSVGTGSFKPLDKIIKDSTEMQFYSSDNILYYVRNASDGKELIDYTPKEFSTRVALSGELRFGWKTSSDSSSSNARHNVKVKVNGATVFSNDVFSVQKGDVITISFERLTQAFDTYFEEIFLYGDILPSNIFERVI